MLEGCLIDVSLVKAVAPGFFCTVLDPELLFLFAFKRSHKLFMCSPKCDYFSWAAGFIWHRNLFFSCFNVLKAREKSCECNMQYGLFFSQNPIRKVTGKELQGGSWGAHPPVIAGIRLKRTAGFITAPGWEIVYYFSAMQRAFYPAPPPWFIGKNVRITTTTTRSKQTHTPDINGVDKFLLFVVINQRWL